MAMPFLKRHQNWGEGETPICPGGKISPSLHHPSMCCPAKGMAVLHWGSSALDLTPIPIGLSFSLFTAPVTPGCQREDPGLHRGCREPLGNAAPLQHLQHSVQHPGAPGACTLRITAYNSKGASSPASITLSQGAGSQEGRISHMPTAAFDRIAGGNAAWCTHGFKGRGKPQQCATHHGGT